MLIDAFCHILPPKYLALRAKKQAAVLKSQYGKYPTANPGLTDLDVRFRVMDKFPGLMQILTIAGPNVESLAGPQEAVDLARTANDELAELVVKYPDRFAAAVACLPLNNVEAALAEADRAIKELRFRGVEIFTDINGQPVDSSGFTPLYEKMENYSLPVLLHPRRTNSTPDYNGETKSKYLAYTNFGWPYETSVAMSRLAFSVLPRYPQLKILTHHAGGMVPFFHKRIELSWDFNEMRLGYDFDGQSLTKRPLDYYRQFYADTVLQGNAPALMCAYNFFGAERILFATDMPYDSQLGERGYRETIMAIETMDIPKNEKKLIFEDNARKLFRLPL